MDFAFTPEQLELREGVRDALKGLDGGPGPVDPAAAWSRLSGLGLTGALVAPEHGGLGLDELDVVLGLEETGWAALPVPVVETALVAARLLTGAEQAGALVAGRRVSAVLDGSGLLPWPGQAEIALVGDVPGGVPGGVRGGVGGGAGGGTVRVLAGGSAGPAAEPVPALDPARPLGRIPPGAGAALAADPAVLARAGRAGALGTAAQLIGLAARALEMTVSYVGERTQFGVPVGSFQAVKHQLADAHLALEMARPLVYAAAWAQAHDTPSASRDVAAAKTRASDAAAAVARAALQCHGAMGYTREYPLHRWLTRIWALRAAWGTPAAGRAVLAAQLGLVAARPVTTAGGTDE